MHLFVVLIVIYYYFCVGLSECADVVNSKLGLIIKGGMVAWDGGMGWWHGMVAWDDGMG
jgi:hypothetical protein